MRISLLFLALLTFTKCVAATALPEVKVAVLATGTVNWELQHIKNRQLDHKNGFNLIIQKMASSSATQLAFMSKSTDMMVSDWLWVADRNNLGDRFRFIPYSKQIGGVIAAKDTRINDWSQLKGKKIGIAGGPTNKGWLLMQAAATKAGFNLKKEADVQFGAPPLMSQALRRGQFDLIVTFWHYAEKLKLQGYQEVFALESVLNSLGMESNIPLLGYVVRNDFIIQEKGVIEGFTAAVIEAKKELKEDSKFWQPLKALMKFSNEDEFEALKRGYIQGDPGSITERQVRTAVDFYEVVDRYRSRVNNKPLNPDLFLGSDL